MIKEQSPTPQELRDLRHKLGLTQLEAANILTVSRRTWEAWEQTTRTGTHRDMDPKLYKLFLLLTKSMQRPRNARKK